jgi:uncharacterized OB-fold protein
MTAPRSIAACPSCGGLVSPEARRCPHCGHRIERFSIYSYATTPRTELARALAGSVVIIVAALLAELFNPLAPMMPRISRCDNNEVRADVSAAWDASAQGQALGVKLLDLDSVRTLSESTDQVLCEATGHFNSGETKPIAFSFIHRKNVGWFVRVQSR